MWNEKNDRYGWNIDRHPEVDNPNPCEGCTHFTDSFPYCRLSAIKSTTCYCDGSFRYYEKGVE